jgi:hypothetical protein
MDTTSLAPPGLLLDPRLDISSDDLNNLPLFGFKTFEYTDDRPDFSFTSFRDILSTLRQDTLLPSFRLDILVNFCQSESSLADGGANVCVINNPDLLLDVVQIDPVPLGTAVNPATPGTDAPLFCTHKGFMPIPLLNGSAHYQPFLINPHASDTIISPENIINNNHTFHCWCQEDHKLSLNEKCQYPGLLSFYRSDGTLLLSLLLRRQQGLYYCLNTSFLPPSTALSVKRTSAASSSPEHH